MSFHHDRPQYPFREGCKILGVSVPTGYKLKRQGLIETFTIGNKRMVTARAIDKCVEAMERRGSVELPKPPRNKRGAK